jgi:hypothetical protein
MGPHPGRYPVRLQPRGTGTGCHWSGFPGRDSPFPFNGRSGAQSGAVRIRPRRSAGQLDIWIDGELYLTYDDPSPLPDGIPVFGIEYVQGSGSEASV